MNKKALELWSECLEKAKEKKKFVDLEEMAIEYARKLNQLLMQDVIDTKGTGYQGTKITLDDGEVARFKENVKKKLLHFSVI